MLEVLQPGLYTTVQDKGRFGYRAYGVPLSGAMDQRAFFCVNWLCGNQVDAAVLEMTVLGARYLLKKDCVIAIAGADMQATCGGRPLENWRSHVCRAGEELVFGYATQGCRAYLAIAGGIAVPSVMNSRSTYARGKIGGLEGRVLKAGDLLAAGEAKAAEPRTDLPGWFTLAATAQRAVTVIRILPGVQRDAFDEAALTLLCSAPYEVSADSDRMGYRLAGNAVLPSAGADIISDALIPGAVQIPGNGLPIIMLADCQTTGGYTKLAQVIQPDLDRLAQVPPGGSVQFSRVSEEEALAIRTAYRSELKRLETITPNGAAKCFTLTINNKDYHVVVEEE